MSLLSRLGGLFASEPVPSILPVPETHEDVSSLLGTYRTDIARMNLISLGREFTPDEIRGFRFRARFGDPRQLYAMYDEMLRLGPGPQKAKAVEAMKSASPQFVTSPEDWNDDSTVPEDAIWADVVAARAARDYLEDVLSPHLEDLIEIHANEHFYGLASSRVRLEPRAVLGRWDGIAEVTEIPARRHRLDPITHEWMLMLSPDSWEGTPIVDLELRYDRGIEGLFFTEIGAGSAHLDQRGLLFQCLVPWNIEQYATRWWMRHVELFGIPPAIGKADFSKPQRVKDMLNALAALGASGSMVVPNLDDIKLLESQNTGAGNPHETIIEAQQRRYDNIILGHSQSTGMQKGVGGKLAGDTALQQFEDLTNSRLRTFSAQLSRGLGRTLIARAMGGEVARRHAPMVKLRFMDRDDPTMLADVALKLKQANAGTKVAAEDLVRRCTLRVAKDGEENLGEATPALAPGMATPALAPDAIQTEQDVAVSPAAVLNGAQIQAATGIVTAVANGLLPRDSGIGQLMVMFNLDRAQAETIMGSVGAGFVAPAGPGTPATQGPSTTLAAVLPMRRPRARPDERPDDLPDAPEGVGEEVVAPYRDLIARAVKDGATPGQVLDRIRHRIKSEADAPELADKLAARMLDAVLTGISSERARR